MVTGEQSEERRDKRVLRAVNERENEKMERVTANPSPQIKEAANSRSDSMKQLME
jgi:hypothetical protein